MVSAQVKNQGYSQLLERATVDFGIFKATAMLRIDLPERRRLGGSELIARAGSEQQ